MSDAEGPTRSPRWIQRSAVTVAFAIGMVLVAGCGPSDGTTALAVDHPRWVTGVEGPSLSFDTECADVSEASVEVGAGVDGVPLVTVWGHPRVGRCRAEVVVSVPAGTTRIEDAATGMVVDLPAS